MALAGWCGRCGGWSWGDASGACTTCRTPLTNSYEVPTPESVAAGAPSAPSAPASPSEDPPATQDDAVTVPAARYDEASDSVVMSGRDLATAMSLAAASGDSAAVPVDAAAVGRLRAVDGPAAQVLDECIAALVNPPRSAVIQFCVADETVSRLSAAWTLDGESVAIVANNGERVTVSLRSPEALQALLGGAVALEAPVEPLDVRVDLSAHDVITLIASLDAIKRARLASVLEHTAPPDAFLVAHVVDVLASASAEDFRWGLHMLDKVVPFDIARMADPAAVSAALDRLAGVGFLTVVPADSGAVALYALADAGVAIYDAWIHEIARLAVTVAGTRDDQPVTETLLFVRDARRMWLLDLAGADGSIACLASSEAGEVLATIAGATLSDAG